MRIAMYLYRQSHATLTTQGRSFLATDDGRTFLVPSQLFCIRLLYTAFILPHSDWTNSVVVVRFPMGTKVVRRVWSHVEFHLHPNSMAVLEVY